MTSPVLFQFMPPLLPSEYLALTESIKTHGVQVPILVDENGAIIDGHHRDQIAAELGIDCPREVRTGLDGSTKRTLAISLNKDRRHLTRAQVQALIEESLKADPQLSDRGHAKRIGVSPTTVGTIRSKASNLDTLRSEIPNVSTRTDALGRQQPATKPERIDPLTGEVLDMDEAEFVDAALGITEEQFESAIAAARADGDMSRAGVAKHFPASTPKVTGMDGKTYPRPEPKQRRKALPDQFMTASLALADRVAAIVRLSEDDRFTQNAEKVAVANRSDLLRAIDALAGVVAKLPERNPS